MATTEAIKPFANGSQYADWLYNNCERCSLDPEGHEVAAVKAGREAVSGCSIYDALATGYWTGEVSAEIAKRMGYDEDAYCWPCPERQEAPIPADLMIREFPR